jgi:hypothetical protein
MSCTYKPHNPATDGPADLYHRMNQIDCAMKKFGGSIRSKVRAKTRAKAKAKAKTRSKRQPKRQPK